MLDSLGTRVYKENHSQENLGIIIPLRKNLILEIFGYRNSLLNKLKRQQYRLDLFQQFVFVFVGGIHIAI